MGTMHHPAARLLRVPLGAAWTVLILMLACHQNTIAARDHYTVLGLTRSATDPEIKRAYKKLALMYHPDKNPKGQARFMEVSRAYEVLSDDRRRRDYDLGGGDGLQHQRQQQHYQQGYRQQRQYSQWGNHWDFENTNYETLLPSSTATLTAGNFRVKVHASGVPWLIMVYSEESQACRAASSVWEATWKLLESSKDPHWASLGRVHYRHQRGLVNWLSQGIGLFGATVGYDEMPVIFGVRTDCRDPDCLKRFEGAITVNRLQEFVADKLLDYPQIPPASPASTPALLRYAARQLGGYKVVALAFGKSAGLGSLTLRRLAKLHTSMMAFHRVQYTDSDADVWASLVGQPLAPPCLVLFKGPGSLPQVVPLRSGSSTVSELDKLVLEQGYAWQTLPALRPVTAAPLGCVWGKQGSTHTSLAELCVVVMGPNSPRMDAARAKVVQLASHVAAQGSTARAAAAAYSAGKLRFAWLDTVRQRAFCDALLTAHGGETLAAAVCHRAWWERLLARARLAGAPPLPPAIYLLAFKPVVDGAGSWFRFKRAPPSFHLSLEPLVPSAPVTPTSSAGATTGATGATPALEPDLGALAAWVSECYAGRRLKPQSVFPPPLVDDEHPDGMQLAWAWLWQAFATAKESLVDLLALGEQNLQAIGTIAALAFMLFINYLVRRLNIAGAPPTHEADMLRQRAPQEYSMAGVQRETSHQPTATSPAAVPQDPTDIIDLSVDAAGITQPSDRDGNRNGNGEFAEGSRATGGNRGSIRKGSIEQQATAAGRH